MNIAPDPLTHAVIQSFGGISKLSRLMDWPTSTVHSCQQNGFVQWRREKLAQAARKHNVKLPDEFLATVPQEDAA